MCEEGTVGSYCVKRRGGSVAYFDCPVEAFRWMRRNCRPGARVVRVGDRAILGCLVGPGQGRSEVLGHRTRDAGGTRWDERAEVYRENAARRRSAVIA